MEKDRSASTSAIFVFAIVLGLSAGSAKATDDYFLHRLDLKAKGARGAGIAFAEEATGIATNPSIASASGPCPDLSVDLFAQARNASIASSAFWLDGSCDGNARDLPVFEVVACVRPLRDRLTIGIKVSTYAMHAPRDQAGGCVPVPAGDGETDLSAAKTSIGFGIGKRF